MSSILPMLPSSSKLALASICAYPWTSGLEWPDGDSSDAARMGTAVHLVAERAIRLEACDLEEMAEDPQWAFTPSEQARFIEMAEHVRGFLADEACEAHYGAGDLVYRTEIGLAYDPETNTARWLESTGQRDYRDVRSGEISGTIDVLITYPDGRVRVRDWKTGEAARQKRALDTIQLRLFGLAAARLLGRDEIEVELAHVDEDGVWVDTATLDVMELDIIAGELRDLIDRMPARLTPVVGPHCEALYCPVMGRCPASIAALEQVALAAAVRYPLRGAIESTEQAVEIRQRLGMIRAVCDDIEKTLKAHVRRTGPIPASPGKVWGPRMHPGRERIDLSVDGAAAVINEALEDVGAAAAIKVTASKSSINDGVKALLTARHGEKLPRGSIKALEEDVIGRLRELKAIKRGAEFEKFEEFKRPDELAEGGK